MAMGAGSPDYTSTNYRSEEHTSELQSRPHLVCRLLLEKKNVKIQFNGIFTFPGGASVGGSDSAFAKRSLSTRSHPVHSAPYEVGHIASQHGHSRPAQTD